jgi:hypothetical protein
MPWGFSVELMRDGQSMGLESESDGYKDSLRARTGAIAAHTRRAPFLRKGESLRTRVFETTRKGVRFQFVWELNPSNMMFEEHTSKERPNRHAR